MFNDIVNLIQQELEKEVRFHLTDEKLFNENCSIRLIQQFSINIPKLDKTLMKSDIRSEQLMMGNSPNGFSFVPGEKYDYAFYTIPFSGETKYLTHIFTNYGQQQNGLSIHFGSVQYKEFSQQPLAGNTQAIEAIRENAKRNVASVERVLEEYQEQANKYNEDDLPAYVQRVVEAERTRRNTLKASKDSLKF